MKSKIILYFVFLSSSLFAATYRHQAAWNYLHKHAEELNENNENEKWQGVGEFFYSRIINIEDQGKGILSYSVNLDLSLEEILLYCYSEIFQIKKYKNLYHH